MLKSKLREIYKGKRSALSKEEVSILSQKIFKRFILSFQPRKGQSVHIFLSIERLREVETDLFVNYLLEKGARVFVPKITNGIMESAEIQRDTRFIENNMGILEPETQIISRERGLDFVITPLLYCDSFGNRVGYGKGFYDAFFKKLSPKTKKIGVNFFPPGEGIDDVSQDDVPLDYLVLPVEVLSFGKALGNLTK